MVPRAEKGMYDQRAGCKRGEGKKDKEGVRGSAVRLCVWGDGDSNKQASGKSRQQAGHQIGKRGTGTEVYCEAGAQDKRPNPWVRAPAETCRPDKKPLGNSDGKEWAEKKGINHLERA